MRYDRLPQAIRRGIYSLVTAQRPSGEFPTYWSRTITMDSPTEVSSPFVTGMIMFALLTVADTERIQERGLEYVRASRRPDGTFAFFATAIDPDLDDTCLLNWLLYPSESSGPFHRALSARIVAMQTHGGLFPTWIREEPGAPNPIDPCVNLNVLRYLDQCGTASPSLVEALRRVFENQPFQPTFYYRSALSFAYLASTLPLPLRRMVAGDRKSPEPEHKWDNGWLSDSLETALNLLIVAQGGGAEVLASALATRLLLHQRSSGAWPASAMFQAFNYWGSPELTTAIAVQALTGYRRVFLCNA